MLVLSRKKNESVYVNGNIRVVIVDVRGDKVQLGIEAPSDVTVYRSEIFEKIQKTEQESGDSVVTLDMSHGGTALQIEGKERASGRRGKKRGASDARQARS